MRITDYLSTTPRTKRAIAEAAGIPVREVEWLILAARLEGIPIVSSGDGYWLSSDPAEVAACAARLRRRAVNQLLTARALRRTARRMAGVEQQELWAA